MLFKLIILMNALTIPNILSMKIKEYFLELFPTDPVPTEYTAYKLLKENPLKTPIVYMAIPWTPLINKNIHQQASSLPRTNNSFSICQHDDVEKIIPIAKQLGITILFTPSIVRGKTYEGITLLPFPHFPIHGTTPAKNKDIFYSFIGSKTHPIRKKLEKLSKHKDNYIKIRTMWHFIISNAKLKEQYKQEYLEVLSRSRYSLCPPGYGISSFRFWESLQAGAIPVLFGRDWKLPENFNWDSCIVYIEENHIEDIDSILNSISLEEESIMRENCLKAHQQFSNENFVSAIREFFDKD